MDKLAKDAAAAIAAGMTYGKYMAAREKEVAQEHEQHPELYSKCEHCGTQFLKKKNKRFCCDHCRDLAYQERLRHEKEVCSV